jgi:hypothetical protein
MARWPNINAPKAYIGTSFRLCFQIPVRDEGAMNRNRSHAGGFPARQPLFLPTPFAHCSHFFLTQCARGQSAVFDHVAYRERSRGRSGPANFPLKDRGWAYHCNAGLTHSPVRPSPHQPIEPGIAPTIPVTRSTQGQLQIRRRDIGCIVSSTSPDTAARQSQSSHNKPNSTKPVETRFLFDERRSPRWLCLKERGQWIGIARRLLPVKVEAAMARRGD